MSGMMTTTEFADEDFTAVPLLYRVLVLAPFRRDAAEICRVLGENGLNAQACATLDQLCDEIAEGGAAALVAEEALFDAESRRLTAAMAEQPTWSDFPVLLMSSRARAEEDGWRILQSIKGTGHLALLERPMHVVTLVSSVRTALESRRRQYQIRDELVARRRAEDALVELNATLERQLAERTEIAEQRARDLRGLAAQLNAAEHTERMRLAKVLHEELQQLLVAARFLLPSSRETPPEFAKCIGRIDELLNECITLSRNLSLDLSPPVLQVGTLLDVVEWLRKFFENRYNLKTAVLVHSSIPPVPEHVRRFVYDAVRELLLNVVKHSGVRQAQVSLACQAGLLAVEVKDGGAGFDPQALAAHLEQPEHFGLFHIRERVEALGGTLSFDTTPNGGARFRIKIPTVDSQPGP